jgi:DNA polymerase III alpha subunit (gram-positive type)
MNILFLDCESNGFAQFKTPSENNKTGRAISLAWQLTDTFGNVVSNHYYLIKPDGWTIPREDFWIKHGYSTWINQQQGFPIVQILQLFNLDFRKASCIVAHNLVFDKKIVYGEMARAKILIETRPLEMCTMSSSKKYCDLKDVRGSLKNPKLTELFFHLFQKDMEGGHHAGKDVDACRQCFFELVKREVISLPMTIIE